MLWRQKFDTFIRVYEEVGYITNRSSFNDLVADASGAVFLKAISRQPQTFEDILRTIEAGFERTQPEVLRRDALEFYQNLEADGFLVSGESPEELDRKDARFSYADLNPKTINDDFTPSVLRVSQDTQGYLENYFKNNPQLFQFQIELTSRCNERCIHCYIPHERKNSDITPELFDRILDECREMGVLSLTLSGGEPMLHPYFAYFLRQAKNYDFSINVLSNLTLLNNEIITEMKANRLSSVQVSLYSMKPEVHEAITGLPGSFCKTRDAILRLIDNDIPLQISCPVMKLNQNCYSEVMGWANEHKVRAVSDYILMARYDHSADNLSQRLDLEGVADIINDIIEHDEDYQQRLREADFNEVEKRDIADDIVCGVGLSSACMVANGRVYPCAGWQGFALGDLTQTTLKEIWQSSPGMLRLRGLRRKDFPRCLNCEDRHFCAMCMVRNANEDPNGDPLNINEHFCQVAKLNRQIVLDWKNKSLAESRE